MELMTMSGPSHPKNLEKRVPRFTLFWTPKLAPKLKNKVLNFGAFFGQVLGPILEPLSEQFWEPFWVQDQHSRRQEGPREPTRAARTEKGYFRKGGFRIGLSAFFRS